jgi:hypothetical protein
MLPVYNPTEHVPAPPAMATLTVTPTGMLHLHTSLREALGLCPDLRPTAKHRILWYDNTRMRARGIVLPPGLVTGPLMLHLYTLTPEYEKYYPMLPSNAFSSKTN